MRKGRIPTWIALMLAAVGLLLVIPGLWIFVSVTATPLYPNPESVPTVMHSVPLPKWAGVVEKTRQMVRASVAEQNLPGLSVAIGVDGEVVWAEGLGFADLKNSVPVTPDHGSPRPQDRVPWNLRAGDWSGYMCARPSPMDCGGGHPHLRPPTIRALSVQ